MNTYIMAYETTYDGDLHELCIEAENDKQALLYKKRFLADGIILWCDLIDEDGHYITDCFI